MGDEDFVFGFLAEADHGWGLEGELADSAFALGGDPAAGGVVLDGALLAGVDGQFAGAEELGAVDTAVDDPLIYPAVAAGGGDGFQVVVVFEVGVDVFLPVELGDDEVEVLVFVFGDVFNEKRPGDFAAFD